MNETMQSILNRRSTRAFLSTPVGAEEIRALEEAALAAPTGMNRQELRFTFITDKELIDRIDRVCRETLAAAEGGRENLARLRERGADSVFYGAPLLILISGRQTGWEKVDAGIAAQNLTLAAESLGLGSCIIGMIRNVFRGENPMNLNRDFSFVDGEEFLISVAIGRKGMEKEAHVSDREHIRYMK